MKRYKRITTKDREDIAVCYSRGVPQSVIAEQLEVSQSTISRELKKGSDRGSYNPFLAQREYQYRALRRRPRLKIDGPTWEVIEHHLALHWSPYQMASFLRNQANDATVVVVSEKTIYNYRR